MNEWNEYERISEELPKVLRFPKTPDARRESRLGDIDDIMDAEPEISSDVDVFDVDGETFLRLSTEAGDLAWPWRRHFARSAKGECVLQTFISQLNPSCHSSEIIFLWLPKAEHLAFSAAPCKLQRWKQKQQTCTGCTLEVNKQLFMISNKFMKATISESQ